MAVTAAADRQRDEDGQFQSEYSDRDRLMALRRADRLVDGPLTEDAYVDVRRPADPSTRHYRSRFGTWKAAVEAVGATAYVSTSDRYDRRAYHQAVRYTDAQVNGPVSKAAHNRHRREGDPCAKAIQNTVGDGSWNLAKFRSGADEFERVSGDAYSMRINGPVSFLRDPDADHVPVEEQDVSPPLRMYDVGRVEIVVTSRAVSQGGNTYHRPRLSSVFPSADGVTAEPMCQRAGDDEYTLRRRDTLFNDMRLCNRCKGAERRGRQ